MALSDETIQKLNDSKLALEDYLSGRLTEIDDLVLNLKNYGAPLESLSANTTEVAAAEALSTIQDLLG